MWLKLRLKCQILVQKILLREDTCSLKIRKMISLNLFLKKKYIFINIISNFFGIASIENLHFLFNSENFNENLFIQ